ncbi:MAG TPA: superoxide dismutase family protein, partial [Thermoanaerobaculia bacterium]
MKKYAVLSLALLAACATMNRPSATATLAPTANNTASGTVRFVQLADGSVDVTVDLANVPAGVHG